MAIHYVRAWSGDEKDEEPVCGANKHAPDVWGHRTNYVHTVTCDRCREILSLPRLTRDTSSASSVVERAIREGL